jgi:putative restriction endonuclease
MANLDGSRSHGVRWDSLAGAMLRDNPTRFADIYRVLLRAARAEGIGPTRLPDFLGLEYGGELILLGQDELDISVLEEGLRERQVSRLAPAEHLHLLIGEMPRLGARIYMDSHKRGSLAR